MNSSGCVRQLIFLFFTAFFVTAVSAADFQPREFNLYGEMGKSMTGWHGQAAFRSIQFELLGRSPFVERWLPKSETGFSLTYSAIHQPRSWEESPKGKVDSQIWISKGKGLPLRLESEVDKIHSSTRYEYGNVKPPM